MPHDACLVRLGHIVAAGFPNHVTQRGNRRQTIFFEPADYALYRDLLAERCRRASIEVRAYCLMPNHVHLVLTPSTPEGLARAIGETHRQCTGFINARARWVRCHRNSAMRIIELNAENWRTALDFYSALLAALGTPKSHGRNLNALVDSMVWGEMNRIEPPYTIRIVRIDRLPKDARDEIEM